MAVFIIGVFLAAAATLLGVVWFALPAGFAGVVWPLVVLAMGGALVTLPVVLVMRLHERHLDQDGFAWLRDSAAGWVRAQIDALGMIAVTVSSYGDEGSAYHPASGRIVLRERVHAEHTVRAWAIAAHELGHAVLHIRHPVLSDVLMACRQWSRRLFTLAVGLLVGTAVVGVPSMPTAAFWLFVIASAAFVTVLVDEIHASARGIAMLRADPDLTKRQVRGAVISLLLAFATYAVYFATFILPLVFWPELVSHIGDGLISAPGATLTGWRNTLVGITSVMLIAGGLAAAWLIVAGKRGGPFANLVGVVAMFVAPVFTFLVCDQAAVLAHPWAIVLAVAAGWELAILPVLIPAAVARNYAVKGIDMVARPSQFVGIRELESIRVARREEVNDSRLGEAQHETWFDRLVSWMWLLLYLPLVAYVVGL